MSFEIQTTSYFDSEAKRLAKRHVTAGSGHSDQRDRSLISSAAEGPDGIRLSHCVEAAQQGCNQYQTSFNHIIILFIDGKDSVLFRHLQVFGEFVAVLTFLRSFFFYFSEMFCIFATVITF